MKWPAIYQPRLEQHIQLLRDTYGIGCRYRTASLDKAILEWNEENPIGYDGKLAYPIFHVQGRVIGARAVCDPFSGFTLCNSRRHFVAYATRLLAQADQP